MSLSVYKAFENKLAKTGAEVLCDCLKRREVKVVFGIPGVHNLSIFEALRRSSIRVVSATHEQAVGFMANGYSRTTDATGVFVTVPGPGFTNAFTSVAESFLDSCAVVCIMTGVRNDIDKRFQLHEIRQIDLAKPIAKAVLTASGADQIFELTEEVFQVAESGEPGPAILEIAANALWERVSPQSRAKSNEKATSQLQDGKIELAKVMDQIQRSKRIGLFVGQGATHAAEKIKSVAEWLRAPVATTLSGRGCLREDHPLSLGFSWAEEGMMSVNRIFDTCDLILALGVKFSETGTRGYGLELDTPLIHVDASDRVFDRNYPASLTFQMDAEEFLDELLERKAHLGPREDNEVLKAIEEQKAVQLPPSMEGEDEIRFILGSQSYSPNRFFNTLREVLPDDAVVVTDTGYHQVLATRHLRVLAPRTLITPSDYQSMGYGIPAAIGAAIALPHKKVVALVGDGGFAMSGFEILTAVREAIDLTVVLFNDGYFGLIKEVQEHSFGATCGVKLATPDFEKLAESFGMHYHMAVGDIGDTLAECIKRKGPVLLEVKVTYPKRDMIFKVKRRWKRDLKQLARSLLRK
jgi:acetolactate synthase-1/2/3 large subunit